FIEYVFFEHVKRNVVFLAGEGDFGQAVAPVNRHAVLDALLVGRQAAAAECAQLLEDLPPAERRLRHIRVHVGGFCDHRGNLAVVKYRSIRGARSAPMLDWKPTGNAPRMVVALSRFKVANGREEDVQEAFRKRPGLVETVAGFLGLEVFIDSEDASSF